MWGNPGQRYPMPVPAGRRVPNVGTGVLPAPDFAVELGEFVEFMEFSAAVSPFNRLQGENWHCRFKFSQSVNFSLYCYRDFSAVAAKPYADFKYRTQVISQVYSSRLFMTDVKMV